jgi:multisubunit Na+/H+ antiporter MnhE subunit
MISDFINLFLWCLLIWLVLRNEPQLRAPAIGCFLAGAFSVMLFC